MHIMGINVHPLVCTVLAKQIKIYKKDHDQVGFIPGSKDGSISANQSV